MFKKKYDKNNCNVNSTQPKKDKRKSKTNYLK